MMRGHNNDFRRRGDPHRIDTRLTLLQQRVNKLEPIEGEIQAIRERIVSQDKDLEVLKRLVFGVVSIVLVAVVGAVVMGALG